jgi:hypothetical protein
LFIIIFKIKTLSGKKGLVKQKTTFYLPFSGWNWHLSTESPWKVAGRVIGPEPSPPLWIIETIQL